MASKVKLKQSTQSLVARGLPIAKPAVVKKKAPKKKKIAPPDPVEELLTKQISFENGLDRCASLLAAMLETPTTTAAVATEGNLRRQPQRKKPLHSRRVIASTPLADDGADKKCMSLPTAVSRILESDGGGNVSDTNTIDELIEEKELLQVYLKNIMYRSAAIEKQFQGAQQEQRLSDIDQNSDATRDNGQSTEKPVTVMQQLPKETANTVLSKTLGDDNDGSTSTEAVTVLERTLTDNNVDVLRHSRTGSVNGTSSETDKSELVSILESITSKLRVDEELPATVLDTNVPTCTEVSKSPIVKPQNGKPVAMVAMSNDNTTAEVKSFSRDPLTDCQQPLTTSNLTAQKKLDVVLPVATETEDHCDPHDLFIQDIDPGSLDHHVDAVQGRYDKIYREYQENLPSCLLVSLGKSSLSSSLNESCRRSVSSHSTTLLPVGAAAVSDGKATPEQKQNVEAAAVSKGDTTPKHKVSTHPPHHHNVTSNNTVCQDQTTSQLTILDSLIKELRSKLDNKWTIDLDQLFSEIDHVVGSLPYLVNLSCSLQSDQMNSVLQPLEAENADLRCKADILSEKVEALSETLTTLQHNDVQNETASVDLILKTVQDKLGAENRLKGEMCSELNELKKSKEMLQAENKSLIQSHNNTSLELLELRKSNLDMKKQMDAFAVKQEELSNQLVALRTTNSELKQENKHLVHAANETELKTLEEKEKLLKEVSSQKHEVALLQTHVSELQLQKQGDDKERGVFDLALRQKDFEIDRLSKLNSSLQESVSRLVADISNAKRGGRDQQQHRQLSASTAVGYASPAPEEIGSPREHPTLLSFPNNITAIPHTMLHRPHMDSELENDETCSLGAGSEVSVHSAPSASLVRSKLSTLSETDFSLWSLATYDSVEFQRNIEHLDAEIQRIQTSMKKGNVS